MCRAGWVRNDPVLTTRGWLLRHYDPVSPGAARGHAAASEHQGVSLTGLGKRGHCGSTGPRSLDELARLRTRTAHHSPVMIALLSINSSHCRPERSFFVSPTARMACKPLCACVDRTKFVAPASVGGPEFFCAVCVTSGWPCAPACRRSTMNGLMHCNKRGGIGWLFNHLVGAGKQSRRHREAERSSSFKVDQ
jgi:hypothetical protein